MSKPLNFNNLKKKFLTVTLADEENTTLMLTTPTKAVLDSFIALKDTITGDELEDETLDELYSICAKILSRNKAGKVITKEKVEEMFDFEDVLTLIRSYTEFISEVTSGKN